MPKFSKKHIQMIQLTANHEKTKRLKKFVDTFQCLDEDFNNVLEFICSIKKENILETPNSNKQLIEPINGLDKEEVLETPQSNEQLIELIDGLDDNEKKDAKKHTVRYPRGKNKGKIISQYLQQQLVEVLSNPFYQSYSALKE
ncbi:15179_t:CDS:1, partial [Dentiscutata heterogama]